MKMLVTSNSAAAFSFAVLALAAAVLMRRKKRSCVNCSPGRLRRGWICTDAPSGLSDTAILRFERQYILPKIRASGQARLSSSSVLVVGAGGLGSPVISLLAAAGVGRIGVVDGDVVEVSNLHRQLLHSERDVGLLKAESAAQKIREINSEVIVDVHSEFVEVDNVRNLVEAYDFVVEATDSLMSKYLINDACRWAGKSFILAAAQGVEGQVALFVPGGACYRCVFSKPSPVEHRTSCADDGVLGPVPYIVGSMQALQTIQYLAAAPEDRNDFGNYVHIFDGHVGSLGMRRIKVSPQRRKTCALCGDTPTIQSLKDSAIFAEEHKLMATCNIPTNKIYDIKVPTVSWTAVECMDPSRVLLLDVRAKIMHEARQIVQAHFFPFDDLETHIEEIRQLVKTKIQALHQTQPHAVLDVLVFCRRGNDSKLGARLLSQHLGALPCNVSHIAGGVNSFIKDAYLSPPPL